MQRCLHLLPQHILLAIVSEHAKGGAVAKRAAPLMVHRTDRFGSRVEQQPYAALTVAKGIFGALAGRDVPRDPEDLVCRER